MKFLKRLFDIAVALLMLVVLAPVLVFAAIVVCLKLGRPIFFCQKRPGLRGEPFIIYKFCTMADARDDDGNLLSDEDRMTSFGRFLRRSSLDELPELLNVLRGDMSLVGPRPLLMEYLDRYTPEQARRHEVRPGITGWAQVNGRNLVAWEERFELDVWYVDNMSLLLDIKILAMTVINVIMRRGISAEDHVTMPVFMGSRRAEDE